MRHEDITKAILGAAMNVHSALGPFNVVHLRQGLRRVVNGYGGTPEKDLPSVSSVSSVVKS